MKTTAAAILFLVSWRSLYCQGITSMVTIAGVNELTAVKFQGERRAQMDDDTMTVQVEEEVALEEDTSSSSNNNNNNISSSSSMMAVTENNSSGSGSSSSSSNNNNNNNSISSGSISNNSSAAVTVGDNIVFIEQPQDAVDVAIQENTGSTIITTSNTTMVLTEDKETGEISNFTYMLIPSPKCSVLGWVCIPTSKFHHFEEFNQDPKGLNDDEREVIKVKYIDYMVKQLDMFITGLNRAVATALVDRYDEFHKAPYMIVALDGQSVNIKMYAIGLVVEDISDIDYVKGVFTADMRVYVFQVTHGAPFNNIGKSQEAAWLSINESSVVDHGDFKYEILRDEYLDVQWKADHGGLLIADGRCNDETIQTMKPIPMNDFNKDFFRIQFSSTALSPIPDSDDNVLYLSAKGAKIKFQPVNSEFFPFQVNLLDIVISTPPSSVNIGKDMTISHYCINSPFTGLKAPFPSLPNQGRLSLVPFIKVAFNAPWFNQGNEQMFLNNTGYDQSEENVPDKTGRSANFRIIYHNDAFISNWMYLLPILLPAFATQLQWIVQRAKAINAANMVTAVVLLQTLVNNSSKAYVGSRTVATDVIALTYSVTFVYITTVAFMSFVNGTKETGKIEFLVKHQDTIFSYLRLIGQLQTPLYIPLLFFYTDEETGQQERIPWLWPVVGTFVITVFVGKVAWDIKTVIAQRRKVLAEEAAKAEDTPKEEEEEALLGTNSKTLASLSPEGVKHWIAKSKELQDAWRLGKEELATVGQKFFDASIDGVALLRLSSNPEQLVKYVTITFGQALAFCDAFERLREDGNVKSQRPMNGWMKARNKLHIMTPTRKPQDPDVCSV